MSEEVWKPVPSVPGLLASSWGRIKAEPVEQRMPKGGVRIREGKPWPGSWDGERYITRFRGKSLKVHRLVCEAFHGPAPAPDARVLHGDEDARNNRPENLAWGDQKTNLNAPGFLAYCRERVGQDSPHGRRMKKKVAQFVPLDA